MNFKITFALRIFFIAMILRLVPVIFTRGLGIGLDDMFQYDMLARSIVTGNGYRWYAQPDLNLLTSYVNFDLSEVTDYDPVRGIPTSFRAPLYPFFLALVYFISGTGVSRFFAARLAQAVLLGAPLAPLTYFTSLHLYPEKESAARISAWTVALYPMLLIYPLGLGTENLFFILVLASFLLILLAFDKPSDWRFLLCGVFLGFACLTRSIILPFAILALIWLWKFVSRRVALVSALALFIVITPWIARNSFLHGRLIGIESSLGYNLYLGYHPQGNGSFIFGQSLDLMTILDDSRRDQIGTQMAVKFIRAQPQRFFTLALNRLGFFFGLEKRVLMYFYSNDFFGHIPLPLLITLSSVLLVPFVLVSTSAFMGFAVFARWQPKSILLTLLFAAYLLPHVFILSEDRFHLALIPFFAILAAQLWVGGLRAMAARWLEFRTGKWAIISAVCICTLLFVNWGFELVRDADKLGALLGPNGNQTYFPF
jgi:hypothetical protein